MTGMCQLERSFSCVFIILVIGKPLNLTPEATADLLKRFEESWDKTEHFYIALLSEYEGWEKVAPILQFIRERRNDDDHHFFRLGTAVHFLVISRSVMHGLRLDQKYIKIMAYNNEFRVVFGQGDTVYRNYTLTSLKDQRLVKLLKTLKDTLVD